MRVLLIVLLCIPLVSLAGVILDKPAHTAPREIARGAVIKLHPDSADVDAYVAIAGVGSGQSITYCIPFYHPPTGFRVERMRGSEFFNHYLGDAHAVMKHRAGLAHATIETPLTAAATIAFAGLGNPVSLPTLAFPVFARARENAWGSPPKPLRMIHPAEMMVRVLYVGQSNVQSGFPARYADWLTPQTPPYCSVLRLTNAGARKDDNRLGMRYAVQHSIGGQNSMTFRYPYTVPAESKPVVQDEVSVIAPLKYELSIKGPGDGQQVNKYHMVVSHGERLLNILVRWPGEEEEYLKEYATREALTVAGDSPIASGTIANGPSAWNRVYFYTSPQQEITVQLHTRSTGVLARMTVAGWLQRKDVAWGLALLTLATAWVLAGRWILHPRWVAAGRPGRYARHLLAAAISTTTLCLVISTPLMIAWTPIEVPSHTMPPNPLPRYIAGMFVAIMGIGLYTGLMRTLPAGFIKVGIRVRLWIVTLFLHTILTILPWLVAAWAASGYAP
jgi:hypothetical protein